MRMGMEMGMGMGTWPMDADYDVGFSRALACLTGNNTTIAGRRTAAEAVGRERLPGHPGQISSFQGVVGPETPRAQGLFVSSRVTDLISDTFCGTPPRLISVSPLIQVYARWIPRSIINEGYVLQAVRKLGQFCVALLLVQMELAVSRLLPCELS